MKSMNVKGSGYDTWLGKPVAASESSRQYFDYFDSICIKACGPIAETAIAELKRALKEILDKSPEIVTAPSAKGSVMIYVIGETDGSSAAVYDEPVTAEEKVKLGREGFLIKCCKAAEGSYLLIAGKTEVSILYGVFSLIRMLKCGMLVDNIYTLENPSVTLRMLNHWDNFDGSVERGYAGRSIFFENGTFVADHTRIKDYARLMSSVGLNGVVINNVNVHKLETLLITKEFLPEVSEVAGIFRQYGIKTFLSINYSSPIELGGLSTADPLDEEVQAWWNEKAKEIYSYIPDFGGFMVKADSEFRPGPFTYGRNHAEGANMLAAALKPFNGLVIWRCFVYNCMQDWRDRVTDRANAAYDNFMPLDGSFYDNVLLQIKNGPMDFQVREPVSPLLGGLKKSNILLEFQITQEYTGQQKHLCYLAPVWKEVLDFDTFSAGKGTTVKKILTDAAGSGKLSGITAVANIGNDLNWTGHDLAQANFYCFGRLAWDPDLTSAEIAGEWIRQTFGSNPAVIDTIRCMLLDSYRIYESYTSPLGIGWMVNPGHHYGPNVDGYEYAAWGTYHRADCSGIGVERTVSGGTGYAGRYYPPNSDAYEKPETCPEELLLFFHHTPYIYRLKSGVTLIQYIYDSHFEGAEQAAQLVEKWKSLEGLIEPGCYKRVLQRLQLQASHSCEWRDVVNTYFLRKSGIPDEKGRKIY